MKSALPKVLHVLAGRTLLDHVLSTAETLDPAHICIVYGHGGAEVRKKFSDQKLLWAQQDHQLGTGHAVMQALPLLPSAGIALILYGDVPLITSSTLSKLVKVASNNKLAWLTAQVSNPTGLGRILRNTQNRPYAIVEEKDATAEQRTINEINTGFLACPQSWLQNWLPTLKNNNAQSEYYLTDVLEMAAVQGVEIETIAPDKEWEITGINSRAQLASLERVYQHEMAARLMNDGVSLADPTRIDIRGILTCGMDVFIDINCVFEGEVMIAEKVKIGANCILRDCQIGSGTEVLPYTYIDGAKIGEATRIGPYARIRPNTSLSDQVHIGNFVEIKGSQVDWGSKINHLSYIGDSSIGKNVNIGAGTITCNYDGANKHRTTIEDDVHVGSDVQLVAPLTVGKGATIAAGTTVWKDAPQGQLILNNKQQINKPGWQRPVQKKNK